MKKDSADIAMESTIGAKLLRKTGVQLYEGEEMLIIRRGEWMSFFNNNNIDKYPPAAGGYLFVEQVLFYIDCTE